MPKNVSNVITAPLSLSPSITDELREEIMKVIKSTKFNKISIPLGAYRSLIDEKADSTDTRVVTVGYIKKYDEEYGMFHVVVFGNSKEIISSLSNLCIKVVYTEYNGKLGVITKIIIDGEAAAADTNND